MERRTFISIAGGLGVGLLLPYGFYRYLSAGTNVGKVGVAAFLNDGPQAALRAITPAEDFYVMSVGLAPRVETETWRLVIDGLVEKPLTLSYDEVRQLPAHETTLTLECISNPVGGRFIGNARWKGTLLGPLIEQVRPRREAAYAVCYAADGFSSGHPLPRFLRPDNFLAYEMNGEPLPRKHGFPLRVFLPGKYGMKMPKWLTRIELVDREYLGYWERQGWSNSADRQLRAVVDQPNDGAQISGAAFVITGYAVGDERGVARVEISFDGGKHWQQTSVFSNPIPSQMWAFWKYVWTSPPRGTQEIRVRAVDGSGRVQTAETSGEWPAGATGQHRVAVEVV